MVSVCPVIPPSLDIPEDGCKVVGPPIELTLPAVLGRGPLLKCAETKVSRRHASLDWDDDGVLIESLHSNPTHIRVSGVLKALKCGETATLHNGDMFGFLPDTSWYRVTCPETPKQDCKTSSTASDVTETKEQVEETGASADLSVKNDKAEHVEETTDNHIQRSVTNNDLHEDTTNLKAQDENKVTDKNEDEVCEGKEIVDCIAIGDSNAENIASSPSASSNDGNQYNVQPELNKRARDLPSWMCRDNDSGASTSLPGAARGRGRRSRGVQRHQAPARRANIVKSKSSVSPSDDDASVFGNSTDNSTTRTFSPKKRQHDLSESSDSDDESNYKISKVDDALEIKESSSNMSPLSSPFSRTERTHELSSSDSQSPVKNNNSASDSKKGRVLEDKIAAESNSQQSNSNVEQKNNSVPDATPSVSTTHGAAASIKASPKKRKRPSCQYGSNCYRSNPLHKRDFAHPGDSDCDSTSEVEADDPNDDRPECEYGIDCYRKNPQHRRQFKHTRLPQPQRKVKRKAAAKKRKENDDELDDYDYDDPFLNDDSSDDYDPTDSGSDSEYTPSQPLDDDERNEMRRMNKEAKRFQKQFKR